MRAKKIKGEDGLTLEGIMEKTTIEQNRIIDRFDAEFNSAEALLEGIYGISTSKMCEESWPSVELLVYKIEDNMRELKKVFKEVTGQNERDGLKEIEDNVSEIQKFTLSHSLKKKAQKKIDEVISMIDSEKKRQKIA